MTTSNETGGVQRYAVIKTGKNGRKFVWFARDTSSIEALRAAGYLPFGGVDKRVPGRKATGYEPYETESGEIRVRYVYAD